MILSTCHLGMHQIMKILTDILLLKIVMIIYFTTIRVCLQVWTFQQYLAFMCNTWYIVSNHILHLNTPLEFWYYTHWYWDNISDSILYISNADKLFKLKPCCCTVTKVNLWGLLNSTGTLTGTKFFDQVGLNVLATSLLGSFCIKKHLKRHLMLTDCYSRESYYCGPVCI